MYAAGVSYIIWKALDMYMDIHVSDEELALGLDFVAHGEFSFKGEELKEDHKSKGAALMEVRRSRSSSGGGGGGACSRTL